MVDKSILPGWERGPFATGVTQYADHDRKISEASPRIHLEVTPGLITGTVRAMVDTAAPWCIFAPPIGRSIQNHFQPISEGLSLNTRLGTFRGRLYLVPLFFPVLQGESLEIEATVFVSPDWSGESFLGYEGLLQRIRFAVDPENNLFYFGRI